MIPSNIRILAGTARGRRLFTIRGYEVRPALARVRNSVFNILRGRFEDLPVADLYAGTGSVGLEALSRGAASCCFVERNRELVEVIAANAAKVEVSDRSRIVPGDVLRSGPSLPQACACIFVDPPYALWDDPEERSALTAFLGSLAASGILAPDGCVMIEHRRGDLNEAPLGGLALADRRRYGGTEVSFYSLGPAA